MAAKFIPLKEAAEMLGVTSEELVEMRSQGEIHGYREGATWKFKAEEVQRVAAERGASLGEGEDDEGSSPSFDEQLEEALNGAGFDADEDDERTMAAEPPAAKAGGGEDVGDSDLGLGSEGDSGSDSGVALVANGGSDSGVALVPDVQEDSDVSIGSDLGLGADDTGGSDVLAPSGGSDVLSGSDVELASPSAGGTGGGTGELELGGSDLELGSDALDMGDEAIGLSDEEIELGDEDDDLVLGGSGVGSDVTLDSADSGINLTSPSDSGLSLEEEPLDLAGSGPSLELPEEEEEEAPVEAPAAEIEETAQFQQDEEFLLAPSDEMGADETDSGSQVIALDGEDMFGEEAGVAEELEPALLAEESVGLEAPLEALDTGGEGMPGIAPVVAPMGAAYELPEAEYTLWNITGLLLTVLFLVLGGVLMIDVVRNIWSWNGDFAATTSLMDAIINALGMKP